MINYTNKIESGSGSSLDMLFHPGSLCGDGFSTGRGLGCGLWCGNGTGRGKAATPIGVGNGDGSGHGLSKCITTIEEGILSAHG
jgi:hypothetical protein